MPSCIELDCMLAPHHSCLKPDVHVCSHSLQADRILLEPKLSCNTELEVKESGCDNMRVSELLKVWDIATHVHINPG